MKYEILKKLSETDGFISGEELSEGVTRAALWKHIKAMKTDGAQIEGVTGKGYRLLSPPDVPRAEYVAAYLRSDVPVYFKETTASTNDDAKEGGKEGHQNAAYIANEQTGGRGRKGRVWSSRAGSGLYITFLFRPDMPAEKLPGITLMAAVAACEAIEKLSGKKLLIKWPNDIIMGDKKLAGILTESMVGMDGVEFAVCGIGINTSPPPSELKEIAAFIEVNRTLLAAALTDSFFGAYSVFQKEGLEAFMPLFRERSSLSGEVSVVSPSGKTTGKLAGYDDDGALLMECGGEIRRFIAGEVTLRGDDF